MFIEHIDQLRCTAGHEESWLVASILEREDRFVLEARLGCHICGRQYPIIGGVAYFGVTPADRRRTVTPAGGEDDVVRVAAFLNTAERSTLVLGGVWGAPANALTEMIPVMVFVLGGGVGAQESPHVALVESAEGIPLGHASIDGVALDGVTATSKNVETALHVLKPGGRLVVPAGVDVPVGVGVLARDEAYWVGEKEREVVALRRA